MELSVEVCLNKLSYDQVNVPFPKFIKRFLVTEGQVD